MLDVQDRNPQVLFCLIYNHANTSSPIRFPQTPIKLRNPNPNDANHVAYPVDLDVNPVLTHVVARSSHLSAVIGDLVIDNMLERNYDIPP
jgi:hypothetical protein